MRGDGRALAQVLNFTTSTIEFVALFLSGINGSPLGKSACHEQAALALCSPARRFWEQIILRLFQNISAGRRGRRYGRTLEKLMSIETTFAGKLAAFLLRSSPRRSRTPNAADRKTLGA